MGMGRLRCVGVQWGGKNSWVGLIRIGWDYLESDIPFQSSQSVINWVRIGRV